MSKLKCPRCGFDIGGVVAAHAGRATSEARREEGRVAEVQAAQGTSRRGE